MNVLSSGSYEALADSELIFSSESIPGLKFPDVLGLAAVEHRLVGSLEVEAGHLHHHVVHVEDILAQFAVVEPFVASRLLVALAAVQGDQQILLVVRQGDVARVGQRRGHIAVRIARVVDQHAVQKFRFWGPDGPPGC